MIRRIIVAFSALVCLLITTNLPFANSLPDNSQRSTARSSSGPVRPEWKIGSPVSYQNMTVFPVLSADFSPSDGFITLDEGLGSGKVVITELGGQRAPNSRVGQSAEVNRLSLSNKSDKVLILIAGEILEGGQQDRMVARDRLVAPGEKNVPLDVFCVEAGRWNGDSSFGHSQNIAIERHEGAANQSVAAPSSGSGTGSGSGSGSGAGHGYNVGGGSPMANPSVRENGEAKKSQQGVWSKVASVTETVQVTSSSSALTANYKSTKVNTLMTKFQENLAKLPGKNVVGAIVAVNGRIEIADVFANPSLFQSYWPKLLKSYGLEALASPKESSKKVTEADEARAFLSAAEGEGLSEGKPGLYRLTENKSKSDSSFILEAINVEPAMLIHFNRVVGF